MLAVTIDAFGSPDMLYPTEVPVPLPGPGQVRVRVAAVAVNPIDARIRSGSMEPAFHTPLPAILGTDVAGIVDAVGVGVTQWAVGDEVIGWADQGAYAEQVLATALVAKPGGLSWQQAASIPSVGETALRVLNELAVESGQTLLIHGGSGAVGSLVTQLAHARGIRVIGTARPEHHEYLRSLGAAPVAYGEGLVDRVQQLSPGGVDAVLDAAGKGVLPDSLALCQAQRILTIADVTASQYGIRFSGAADTPDIAALSEAVGLLGRGEITLPVSQEYPLERAEEAHVAIGTGHTPGKLVLLP